MAVDFSKFEEKVDLNALQKEVEDAKEFEDVPDGTYIVSIEKMEIVETKAGDKLMFSVSAKVKEGDHKGRFLKFFNRVICGNTSPKWTDGQAIKSVCTWVNKLIAEDAPVEFVNYQDFADQILDVFQSVKDAVELEVDYKGENFNPITIKEVFDI